MTIGHTEKWASKKMKDIFFITLKNRKNFTTVKSTKMLF